MILSIRHRILIPFTLITVFMTFSAMLICIELVNSFYNNQLQTQASTIVMPIEKVLHQFATKALLDHNHPNKDSSFETVMNASNQQRLYSLGTNSNGFEVIDNHSNVVFKAPFNFSGIRLPAGLANVYIQSGSKLFNVKSLSTELAFPTHATTDIVKNNNKFRRYFYNHPRIKHLYFDVDVYSQGIERKRSITLASVIGALLFINTFIVLLFFFILKHITRSVSNLTHAASQIAKGQITTPMKVKSNDEFGLLAQSFNNMLNNVQTKTAELIYERNRSKMILAQLPDGIIVTDLNHKLLLANRAAETMLGFSTDSARGQVLIRYLKMRIYNHFLQMKWKIFSQVKWSAS